MTRKVVIEYDLDELDGRVSAEDAAERELADWLDGAVDMNDFVALSEHGGFSFKVVNK